MPILFRRRSDVRPGSGRDGQCCTSIPYPANPVLDIDNDASASCDLEASSNHKIEQELAGKGSTGSAKECTRSGLERSDPLRSFSVPSPELANESAKDWTPSQHSPPG